MDVRENSFCILVCSLQYVGRKVQAMYYDREGNRWNMCWGLWRQPLFYRNQMLSRDNVLKHVWTLKGRSKPISLCITYFNVISQQVSRIYLFPAIASLRNNAGYYFILYMVIFNTTPDRYWIFQVMRSRVG